MRTALALTLSAALSLLACGGQVSNPNTVSPQPPGSDAGCAGEKGICTGISSNNEVCTFDDVCVDGVWTCESSCHSVDAGSDVVIIDPGPPVACGGEPIPDCGCATAVCDTSQNAWVCEGDCFDAGYPDASYPDGGDPDVISFPPPPPIDAGDCFGSPPSCIDSCGVEQPSFCDGSGNWACPSGGTCFADAGVGTFDAGTLPP